MARVVVQHSAGLRRRRAVVRALAQRRPVSSGVPNQIAAEGFWIRQGRRFVRVLCIYVCSFCWLSRARDAYVCWSVSPLRLHRQVCGNAPISQVRDPNARSPTHARAHTHLRTGTDMCMDSMCTCTGLRLHRSRRRWEGDRAIFMQRTLNPQYLPAVLHAVAAALQPLLARAELLALTSPANVCGDWNADETSGVVSTSVVSRHIPAHQDCAVHDGGKGVKVEREDASASHQDLQPQLRKARGQGIDDSVVKKWACRVHTQNDRDAEANVTVSRPPRSPLDVDLREEAGETRVGHFCVSSRVSTHKLSQTQSHRHKPQNSVEIHAAKRASLFFAYRCSLTAPNCVQGCRNTGDLLQVGKASMRHKRRSTVTSSGSSSTTQIQR